jgi:hypothetical protein
MAEYEPSLENLISKQAAELKKLFDERKRNNNRSWRDMHW